ncbi:flagellar hook-basal body protein [Geobacter argillaceus]|uniref:Flagellar hook protein FlgE n=1 Tax=Geobacter argillaceus TaxID=345631 RepID=A0A562VJ93_9BACT|nr:flagellar hook-basal body complex protein [Geobacter argillaceus]TWJ18036.1 flagellar hook protein FlgE [Geobacter argillaceus]
MSVTSAMFTGVSGLLNNGEAINVIGNNIANVNTTGFKSSRTLFDDMLYTSIGNNSQVGRGMAMQKIDNIFSSGSTQNTSSVTDLALQGNSFFALKPPTTAAPVPAQNSALLSRAGSFHVDSTLTLINPEGYQVLDTQGNPIKFLDTGAAVATDFSKVVKIEPNGLISYLAKDGVSTLYYNTSGTVGVATTPANALTVQKLAIVSPVDPSALEKAGGNLYNPTAAAGIPAVAFSLAANAPNGTSNKVLSNSLEQSNVDMATEFVNLIMTQRAYSANSKTITTADEMTQEVLNLKR